MQAETVQLSERQREIFRRVVEEFVGTGKPVGSKTLVERSDLRVSPSTVRAELAELENLGLLAHPHTSAGRVPTERGYRYYADELLGRLEPHPAAFPLDLTSTSTEVEAALQATTEMLSQVTRLLALVSAPPLEATRVRHVEVLLLQPQLVMVVVITSTGGVSKRLFHFDDPVDAGLAQWASDYLNEAVTGLQLGTGLLQRRFEDEGLSQAERAFLAALRPAFTELVSAEQRLYVGGAADLLGEVRAEELDAYRNLFELVERRADLLDVLGQPRGSERPFVRLGHELAHPGLAEIALVGACYGLVHRTLGAVNLVGPVRMDYEKALGAVRSAALELSRFVESIYDETKVSATDGAATFRRWRRPTATTTSCSASGATQARRRSSVPSGDSRASSIPTCPRRLTRTSGFARWSRRTRCSRRARRGISMTATATPG
jgi:heat-inducible transcriptional repressor